MIHTLILFYAKGKIINLYISKCKTGLPTLFNSNPAIFFRGLKNIFEKNLSKDSNSCHVGYFKTF